MSCGCNNNAVKVPATEKLDGKPNLDPKGGYAGVGGTVKWPTK
jgi:hypothetical protein